MEGALSIGDLDIIGFARMRSQVYDYGAFWPGLLNTWTPNYAAQPYAMFLTYSFLHSGLVHLSVNMITLWSLGRAVLNQVGQVSFVIIYAGASLGGAAVFALLAHGLRPMVGASGALFGLLGAILAWEYVDTHTDREGRQHIVKVILLLAGLNFVLWWAMGGQLAWQAHLGGFVVGWMAALLITRKPLKEH